MQCVVPLVSIGMQKKHKSVTPGVVEMFLKIVLVTFLGHLEFSIIYYVF